MKAQKKKGPKQRNVGSMYPIVTSTVTNYVTH
jgi:hypothetical protein